MRRTLILIAVLAVACVGVLPAATARVAAVTHGGGASASTGTPRHPATDPCHHDPLCGNSSTPTHTGLLQSLTAMAAVVLLVAARRPAGQLIWGSGVTPRSARLVSGLDHPPRRSP
jgi:hypothetical protein